MPAMRPMAAAELVALACVGMALLTAAVAVRLLLVRVRERRERRMRPQQNATSLQVAASSAVPVALWVRFGTALAL